MKTKEEIEAKILYLDDKRETTLLEGPRKDHIKYRAMVAALKWVLEDEE